MKTAATSECVGMAKADRAVAELWAVRHETDWYRLFPDVSSMIAPKQTEAITGFLSLQRGMSITQTAVQRGACTMVETPSLVDLKRAHAIDLVKTRGTHVE